MKFLFLALFLVPVSQAAEYTLKLGESVIIGGDRIICEGGGNVPRGCYTASKCMQRDGKTIECSGGASAFVVSPAGYCITEVCHFSRQEALAELDRLDRRGYCH